MYEQIKYELNKMLNQIPLHHDTIITITRTGGDILTFYQYERYKIRNNWVKIVLACTDRRGWKVVDLSGHKKRPYYKGNSYSGCVFCV